MKNEYLFIFQKNKNIHFHPHDGEIGEFHFVHAQCVQRYSNSIIRKTIPHMMMMRKKFTLKNCMLMIIEYFLFLFSKFKNGFLILHFCSMMMRGIRALEFLTVNCLGLRENKIYSFFSHHQFQ